MKTKKFILSGLILVGLGTFGIYKFYSPIDSASITIDSHALLPQFTKQELIRQSDIIVLGKVKSMTSTKIPSVVRENEIDIVTYINIQVEKYLRNYGGIDSTDITLQTLGGTVGNMTMNVLEAPSFAKNERVLVFLKKNPEGILSVYGWAAGKYSVADDGSIGVGERERGYFRDIFGIDRMTLDEIAKEIELYKNDAPIPEQSSNKYDEENLGADEKNAEANRVLENSAE